MQSFAIHNFPCLVGRSLPALHRAPQMYGLVICYNVQGTQMLWYLVPNDGYFHLGLSVPAGASAAQTQHNQVVLDKGSTLQVNIENY
jgi:hypothetical protein